MSFLTDEMQQRRDRAIAADVAVDSVNRKARLRQATSSGTTPTPASVGGFFDETGAYNDFMRCNDPCNSLKPLGY